MIKQKALRGRAERAVYSVVAVWLSSIAQFGSQLVNLVVGSLTAIVFVGPTIPTTSQEDRSHGGLPRDVAH